jgi:condensin-2 complex subunit G2
MEKRLRSSLQSSAQEFLSLAKKQSLKSSKPTLKSLIHNINPNSDLSSSLPISLHASISHSIQSFQNLLEPNPKLSKSPRSPPIKRRRRSSRHSKTLVEPDSDHYESDLRKEKQKVLEDLEILACIALLCVSHPKKAFSPSDLLPGVRALHDNLILFDSDSVLLSEIANLCEEWWKEDLPGRETLISQSLPFLLSKSLTLKRKVDVHRVYSLREAFALFDYEDESIEDLKLLLIRCVIAPLYLKTEDGRRFLAFVFGLSNQLVKEMLAMIRSQIPFGRKSMLEAYGDILFRAWKAAEGDSKGEIENGFLQGFIDGAIHASSCAFAASIRRVLGGFISQRTTKGVEKLLFRLAEPVIFRSLQVFVSFYQ